MLYSGVLMKLGAYGILRIGIYLMPSAAGELSWLLMTLAAITVIYGAVGTMLQKDFKQMHVYSSITFSGLIIFVLMLMNKTALTGAVLLMISHGLVSALLFALSEMIMKWHKTGLISEMTGLLRLRPFLAGCYVFAILALAGLPGLSGSFAGVFQQPDKLSMILSIVIFSFFFPMAVWMIFRIARVIFVPFKNAEIKQPEETGWQHRTALIILILPVMAFVASPNWFSSGFAASIQQILIRIAAMSQL
jgi:NADH-quinone oxidoreductase subunit M